MSEDRDATSWAIVTLLLFIFGIFTLPSPRNIAIIFLKGIKNILPFLPKEAQRANQIIDNSIWSLYLIGWVSLILALFIYIIYLYTYLL